MNRRPRPFSFCLKQNIEHTLFATLIPDRQTFKRFVKIFIKFATLPSHQQQTEKVKKL